MEDRLVKRPLRAIHLFPQFSSMPTLERVRAAYDPLAGKIPPHITLVFPFASDVTSATLAQHVGRVSSSMAAFPIALGPPETRENGLIWLPITEGRMDVVSLHHQLYRGPLSDLRNQDIPYEPHVTIARVEGAEREAAFRMACRMSKTFSACIDRIVIEQILPDESSRLESTIYFAPLIRE